MGVIAVIEDPEVVKKILIHLGLWLVQLRPPPKKPMFPTIDRSEFEPAPRVDAYCADPDYSWDDYMQS